MKGTQTSSFGVKRENQMQRFYNVFRPQTRQGITSEPPKTTNKLLLVIQDT